MEETTLTRCHMCVENGDPRLHTSKRYVECMVCGIKGPQRDNGTKKKDEGKAAVDAWNFYSDGLYKAHIEDRNTVDDVLILMYENKATLRKLAKKYKESMPLSPEEYRKNHKEYGLWMYALGEISGWAGAQTILECTR